MPAEVTLKMREPGAVVVTFLLSLSYSLSLPFSPAKPGTGSPDKTRGRAGSSITARTCIHAESEREREERREPVLGEREKEVLAGRTAELRGRWPLGRNVYIVRSHLDSVRRARVIFFLPCGMRSSCAQGQGRPDTGKGMYIMCTACDVSAALPGMLLHARQHCFCCERSRALDRDVYAWSSMWMYWAFCESSRGVFRVVAS